MNIWHLVVQLAVRDKNWSLAWLLGDKRGTKFRIPKEKKHKNIPEKPC